MKRIIALLLGLSLMLSFAFAEDELYQKLLYQVQNGSGLQIEISLETEGKLPELITKENGEAWALLLNGVLAKLNFQQTNAGTQKGREQLSLNLTKGENEVASFSYLTDGSLEQLSSSLLQSSYVGLKGEGVQHIVFASSIWPAIEGLFLNLETKNFSYKTKLDTAIEGYKQEITQWLSRHTSVEASGDFVVTIPANEIKTELKALIERFYSDENLLSVLKESASVSETQAYLNPEVKPLLISAIDGFNLEGDIVIHRSFHPKGELKTSEITLPLSSIRGIKSVTVSQSLDENGNGTNVYSYVTSEGLENRLEIELGANNAKGTLSFYKGEEKLELPFTANYEITKLVLNQLTGENSQSVKLDLSLNEGATVISANIDLVSGSRPSQPTNIKGSISVTEGANKLKLDISGKTVAPWSIPNVSTEGTVRLDNLTEEQKLSLYKEILEGLAGGFAKLGGMGQD